ncbi:hypothetical protein OIK40_02910 [Erythrobacter sp. sf7]|uniref:Uncharacterized protein n=1 Tax=Erythrobacter fulvus TaxID=2987523 RepID=A0ABT5JLF7_9SPHN|nr:hypothetical protein [Erythrobacter fulvus]
MSLAIQAWTLICGLYFLWEALAYRGLFGRLAEFQIARFGSYVPLLTYLVLFTLALIPAWIIAWFFARRREEDLDLAALLELRISQARKLRLLIVALATASVSVAAGFAIYAFWFLPGQDGELRTIAASEFGAVPINEGPTRIVGGELGTVIFFGQDWFIGDDRMAFSPYRPVADGDGLSRVFVQLETTGTRGREAIVQRPAWSGIIVEGGLPGTVRVLFNYIGVGISDPYYTLYQNEYALKVRFWLQAMQWAFLTLFLTLLIVSQTRTIKKLERQKDAAAPPAY